MNRRSFFSAFLPAADPNNSPAGKATGGIIDPYTKPLNRAQVCHLLRRLSFGPTPAQIQQLEGKTATEAVKILLDNTSVAPAPPSWIDTSTENPYGADLDTRFRIEGGWRSYMASLQGWWLNAMISESLPVSEKLTLFWSSHFTTEFAFDDAYIPPQMLYRQNAMLRENRLGKFNEFVEKVTLDASMLVYLGGVLNTRRSPNENYARELMELYTTGLGHYTEGDVKEAARVLTGWRVGMYNDEPRPNEIYNSYFSPNDHDIGAKQFMGRSIPARDISANTEYLVKTEEIRQLISILFEVRGEAISNFIARKVYKFFFYSNPSGVDEEFVKQAGAIFKNNDFQLRPLFEAMLSSTHFYDERIIGAQIKTPAELVAGLVRQFGLPISDLAGTMRSLEQELIDPPTVAGWDGYRRWITTKTYPNRRLLLNTYFNAFTDDQLLAFARNFPDYEDAALLVQAIVEYLLPVAINQERLTFYTKEVLLQKQPDYEWQSMLKAKAPAARGIKALLQTISKAPDFQLC